MAIIQKQLKLQVTIFNANNLLYGFKYSYPILIAQINLTLHQSLLVMALDRSSRWHSVPAESC